MKKNQKRIQIILLALGFFLILLTYFYYPYINENKAVVEKSIDENFPAATKEKNENSTSFESIEYQGIYDLDKTFVVRSEKANINNEEPNIVHMTNMHVVLYLNDGRIVNILSDKGKYNKSNYDCFFEKKGRATDGEVKILSDNLELLGNESSVKIYNNVSIDYPTGSVLNADKIDYDFEKKQFRISMMSEDGKIKMKIIK